MSFLKPLHRLVTATCLAGLAILGSLGCGRRETSAPGGPVYSTTPPPSATRTIHFAVHPLHNPKKLLDSYQPLMDHLSGRIDGMRFEVEASRDYQEYERKFTSREPEFLLPNPWQTLEAMKCGYTVIAMAGEPEDFKGLFIVRRDAGIRTVADIRGKSVAYPSKTALAACVMPQWYLHSHGIDVNRELDNRYVGSQESAIMNAYLRETAVGVTWPPPWRAFVAEHPREAEQLQVIWETDSLLNNSVMARADIPMELRQRVADELLALTRTEEGRALLAGISARRFLPADDKTYEVVRQFVERFEAEVRPVKGTP